MKEFDNGYKTRTIIGAGVRFDRYYSQVILASIIEANSAWLENADVRSGRLLNVLLTKNARAKSRVMHKFYCIVHEFHVKLAS